MNRHTNARKGLMVRTARGDRRRRGSAYLAVLGAAAIVSIIGLSALLIARIDLRRATDTTDLAQARLCAMSGTDVCLLMIEQNRDTWRDTFIDAGGALPKVDIGSGSFELRAVDPVDGDLADGYDPVLLTAIGYAGRACYKLQVRLEPNGLPTPGTWKQVVN